MGLKNLICHFHALANSLHHQNWKDHIDGRRTFSEASIQGEQDSFEQNRPLFNHSSDNASALLSRCHTKELYPEKGNERKNKSIN